MQFPTSLLAGLEKYIIQLSYISVIMDDTSTVGADE